MEWSLSLLMKKSKTLLREEVLAPFKAITAKTNQEFQTLQRVIRSYEHKKPDPFSTLERRLAVEKKSRHRKQTLTELQKMASRKA